MGFYRGTYGIELNGLILAIDSGANRSYSGSGNWKNLTNDGGEFTMSGPTYTAEKSFLYTSTNYSRMIRTDMNGGTWAYPVASFEFWLIPYTGNTTVTSNNIFTVEVSLEISLGDLGNGTSAIQWASNPWAWRGNATDGVLTNDIWNHICYIHTATSQYLYINGILKNTVSGSGTLKVGSSTYPYTTLMGRYTGTTSNLNGELAIVRVYNREITAAEVLSNFNIQRIRFGL